MVIQNKGFTIIELMVGLAVMGVILSMAVPSVSGYMEKRRIIDVTEAVYSQLQLARSEAISRSVEVRAVFDSDDSTTWRMALGTETGCDVDPSDDSPPDVADDCTLVVDDGDGVIDPGDGSVDPADLVYYGINSADFPGVSLGDSLGNDAIAISEINFNPVRGTVNSETITIKLEDKYEMRVIVYMTGRVRICSPSGTTNVGGYIEC